MSKKHKKLRQHGQPYKHKVEEGPQYFCPVLPPPPNLECKPVRSQIDKIAVCVIDEVVYAVLNNLDVRRLVNIEGGAYEMVEVSEEMQRKIIDLFNEQKNSTDVRK